MKRASKTAALEASKTPTLDLITKKPKAKKDPDTKAMKKLAAGLKREEAEAMKAAPPPETREFVIPEKGAMVEVEPTRPPELPDNVNAFLGAAALEVAKAETPRPVVLANVAAGACALCGRRIIKGGEKLPTGEPVHRACHVYGVTDRVKAQLAGAGK